MTFEEAQEEFLKDNPNAPIHHQPLVAYHQFRVWLHAKLLENNVNNSIENNDNNEEKSISDESEE